MFTVPIATRRQQRRTATLADIKAAALRQLRDVGPAALSLRAVAAELEMSAGALYRYYDGRDGLLTELITDGFADLAAALTRVRDQHDGDDIADALFAVSMAYRRWAMQHPHEFALLYGTPIPDYAAPVDGPTSMASRSVGQVFIPLLIDGWRAGRLRVLEDVDGAATLYPLVAPYAASIEPNIPPEVATTILACWTRIHGPVILEVFGHLHWLAKDAEPVYASMIRGVLSDIGLRPLPALAASSD